MRFRTRYDRSLVLVLAFAAVASSVLLPASRYYFQVAGAAPPALWISFLPTAVWLVVLASSWPQFYEIRDDGLFVRQGWRKTLIAYNSLKDAKAVSDSRSAGVFSARRITLNTRDGKDFTIAVAEEERFLAELGKRCPRLKHVRRNS